MHIYAKTFIEVEVDVVFSHSDGHVEVFDLTLAGITPILANRGLINLPGRFTTVIEPAVALTEDLQSTLLDLCREEIEIATNAYTSAADKADDDNDLEREERD